MAMYQTFVESVQLAYHAICFQRANGTLGKTTLWTPEYIEQLEQVSADYVSTVAQAESDVKGETSEELPTD